MNISFDRRFPTSNTNLAACLAALRIPIKTQDPVYVVEEGEGPKARTVTYFFEEESAPNNDGLPVEQATHVDWAWRNRKEFEEKNPEHPVVFMRRAIDRLEWLIKVKYGQIKPSARTGFTAIATTDIILAACIMASGHELHSIGGSSVNSRNDTFLLNVPELEYERIVEEFECFRHGKDPVCYMRKALEARKLLIGLVKRSPVLVHYQNGDPSGGGREGFIPKGCSSEQLNQFFQFLYE